MEELGASIRRLGLVLYAAGLSAIAVGTIAALIAVHAGLGSPWAVAVLCCIALYAEQQTVRMTAAVEFSVTPVLVIFAAVLFGPLAAVVVGVTGLLVNLRPSNVDQPYLRWLIWSGSQVLIGAVAGITALAIQHGRSHTLGNLLLAVAGASVAEMTTDVLVSPIPAVLRGSASWRELTKVVGSVQLSGLPLHIPLISVLAYVYLHLSPWSVVLFVIPAIAAQRLFLLYSNQRQATRDLASANARLENANVSFAAALVATLDARDEYTAGHSTAVAIYARDIAHRMGLSPEDQAKAHLCGLVHDIGKIGLPPGLLEKPGPLNLDERQHMQQHAIIGERILSKVDSYSDIAQIVRHHHERIDGLGYPDALCGDEIPLMARILAVADAYNAMTSDRPYRDAMPSRIARLRLAQAVEGQFDTSVVAAFEAVLARASESYRMGAGEGFAVPAATEPESPALFAVA